MQDPAYSSDHRIAPIRPSPPPTCCSPRSGAKTMSAVAHSPTAMPPRGTRQALGALSQILFFVAVWWLAQAAVQWLHWRIPAAVLGLFAVLLLLASKTLPERHLASGAHWLLGEMLLFFIPPLLAVVRFGPLLAASGWRLLAAIALGSLLVMAGTGLSVERVARWERARRPRAADIGSEQP